MHKPIAELKDQFKGQDIFVIGSGASLDCYPRNFFEGRIMIGSNLMWGYLDLAYCVFTHKPIFASSLDYTKCVVAEFDPAEQSMTPNEIESEHMYWTFKNGIYRGFEKNLEMVGDGEHLCMGNTVITLGIELAAFLGAHTIFLVGVDCAVIENALAIRGYYEHQAPLYEQVKGQEEASRIYWGDMFLRNIKEISMLREKIMARYGCPVVSLSPFVGLKQENKLIIDNMNMRDFLGLREMQPAIAPKEKA